MKKLLLSIVAAFSLTAVSAQQVSQEEFDKLKAKVEKQDKKISGFSEWAKNSWFKNLKLSGYTHIQWQMAQEEGLSAPYSGGVFSDDSDNHFQIRRARLKLAYKSDYLSAAIQINGGQSGVSLVEAATNFHLPNGIFGASVGQVYLPFTYYLEYSSSARVAPEMPRAVRALMPSDTGLGANVQFGGKKGTELNNLKLIFGVYSSNGNSSDIHSRKQTLTRLMYSKKYDNGINLSIMGGLQTSGVLNLNNESYTYAKGEGYVANSTNVLDKYNNSIYYNLGAKFGFDSPLGRTELMGETLWGKQPGGANVNATLSKLSSLPSFGPIYNRKFNSMYVNMDHKFKNTNLTFVARYDNYNPNREIKADQIGIQAGTGIADVKFSTLGTGLAYDFLKGHLRLVAFYEFVWNSKTDNLEGYNTNIKDNMLTIRVQAKF